MRPLHLTLLLPAALFVATAAHAQTWNEISDGGGDAGDRIATAQRITLTGPLAAITGISGSSDADLFVFRITDAEHFSATTSGGATWNTMLFLFDESGRGVTANDEDPINNSHQSRLSSLYVPGPGVYQLAITRFNRVPVNMDNGPLWATSGPARSERAPDGPGLHDPVAGWVGTTTGSDSYTIFLQGCQGLGTSPPPCPADFNGDGQATVVDFLNFLQAYAAADPRCDMNADTLVNIQDFLLFLGAYALGC
jgi:hypothetical protein